MQLLIKNCQAQSNQPHARCPDSLYYETAISHHSPGSAPTGFRSVPFCGIPILWNNEAVDNQTAERTHPQNGNRSDERSPAPGGSNGAGSVPVPENPLSEREMDVAELLVTGISNNEIASALVISPHTVKVHLRNIYEKLAVNSRTEASMLLLQQGWVQLPGVEAPSPDSPAPPPPAPQPLTDAVGPLFGWQRVYLAGALLIALASVLLPGVLSSRITSPPTLLSDGPVAMQAQPVLAELPRWEARTPLTRPRDRFALVAASDDLLLAIGGETSQGQILASVEAYDLRVNEWRTVAPLPVPLSNLAAASHNAGPNGVAVYVAGGTKSSEPEMTALSDLLWRYQPAEDRWQAAGRLPTALAGTQLLADESGLYLLGGWDGEQMRAEVWHISPPQEAAILPEDWVQIATLPSARAFFGARLVNETLYIVGGQDSDGERADAHSFSLQTGAWQQLPSLSTPRAGLTLLYDGLALFAVGGGNAQATAVLERYDPITNLWSNAPVPISGEWRHLGAATDKRGRLFLAGGWSGGYLNVHFHYQSSFHMFLPSTRKSSPLPSGE